MLAADAVRVVYWPPDRGTATRVLRAATAPLTLPGIGRRPAVSAATIVLAPSPALFDSLTSGRAPRWSAGIAVPGRRLIVLPAYPSARTPGSDPILALRHELVHLAVHQHLGDAVPRWFDEGYATWASGEFDQGAAWRIRIALLRGVAPPLDSISLGWPASESGARLAYLLSASAVEYLATRNGEPAFTAFLARWRRGGAIDPAMRETYLMTVEQFEKEWRGVVRRRYGWLLALAQVGVFWGIITVLFLVLGMRRRERDRARIAAMHAEESLLPPGAEGEGEPEEWELVAPAPVIPANAGTQGDGAELSPERRGSEQDRGQASERRSGNRPPVQDGPGVDDVRRGG